MSAVSLRRFVGTALTSLALTSSAPWATWAAARTASGDLHDGSGSTLTFKSGEVVLAADGSYTLEVEAEFNGGDVNMTDEGNYAGGQIDPRPLGG
jgi:hypothetical protein